MNHTNIVSKLGSLEGFDTKVDFFVALLTRSESSYLDLFVWKEDFKAFVYLRKQISTPEQSSAWLWRKWWNYLLPLPFSVDKNFISSEKIDLLTTRHSLFRIQKQTPSDASTRHRIEMTIDTEARTPRPPSTPARPPLVSAGWPNALRVENE